MTDSAFIKLFPRPWRWQPWEAIVIQEVVLNWLDIQVDPAFVAEHAVLQELSGWRTREVVAYMRAIDWTESLYTDAEKAWYADAINEGRRWRERAQ